MIDRLFRHHRHWHRAITDVVAGEATTDQAARVERHARTCASCRDRLEAERELRAALVKLPLVQPSRSLRLTPAMLESPAGERPRPRVPAPLLVTVRVAAAASLLVFASVATYTLAGNPGGSETSSASPASDAGISLLATAGPESAPAADLASPDAAPAPFTTPPPGVASPPHGGGVGASATEPSVATQTPMAPAAGYDATTEAGSTGEPHKRSLNGTDASADDQSVATLATAPPREKSEDRQERGILLASGAVAVCALIALGAVEISRRRA